MTQLDRGSLIIPVLRYRDAPAAIDFLARAFGFEPRIVVPGAEPNSVVHAQLCLGPRMVMLATQRQHGDFDRLMTLPLQAHGNTQAIYVVVEDVDAHCARAVAAGATVVTALADWDHGGRGYTCTDCEGHVWSFGSYDPWTAAH